MHCCDDVFLLEQTNPFYKNLLLLQLLVTGDAIRENLLLVVVILGAQTATLKLIVSLLCPCG